MVLLGAGGALFDETILTFFDVQPDGFPVILLNVVGILYLSFGVLNWMAREVPIGGIYSRPVAIGNFAHFFGVTVALTQHVTTTSHTTTFLIGTAAYALFAAGFGYLVFAGGESCG